MARFTLEAELGNEAMRDGADVAELLERTAAKLRGGFLGGPCVDLNGNTVGRWELEPLELEDG